MEKIVPYKKNEYVNSKGIRRYDKRRSEGLHMKELNSWKIFEQTGTVRDYLNYRQECADRVKGIKTDECREYGRDNCTGYHSSERASGRI